MTQPEPQADAFPQGSVFVRNVDGKLLRVTDSGGTKVLWRADAIDLPVAAAVAPAATATEGQPEPAVYSKRKWSHVSPEMVSQIVERRKAGDSIRDIATEIGIGQTTVESYLRKAGVRKHSASDISDNNTHNILIPFPDFPKLENQGKGYTMPYAVRNAIEITLSSNATMAILTDQPVLKGYFDGYTMGFTHALAIICGAAGIDLSFLEAQHDS